MPPPLCTLLDLRKEALKIRAFDFYESDLDCMSVLKGEFERWKARWDGISQTELPHTAIDALNRCASLDYPKILILLQIFGTLPVTTSSAERSFSALKLLKTDLRSVMGELPLNALASMHLHGERYTRNS